MTQAMMQPNYLEFLSRKTGYFSKNRDYIVVEDETLEPRMFNFEVFTNAIVEELKKVEQVEIKKRLQKSDAFEYELLDSLDDSAVRNFIASVKAETNVQLDEGKTGVIFEFQKDFLEKEAPSDPMKFTVAVVTEPVLWNREHLDRILGTVILITPEGKLIEDSLDNSLALIRAKKHVYQAKLVS